VDPIWLWLRRLSDEAILNIKESLLHPEIIEQQPHIPVGPGPVELAQGRGAAPKNMEMIMAGLKSKFAKESDTGFASETASAKDTTSGMAILPQNNVAV